MRVEARIALLQTIHVGAWAAYFTITRQVYSGDSSFLILLAAAETLPTIAGLLGGWLSERYGYRIPLLLGSIEGLGLMIAGLLLHEKQLFWASVFAASLAWSIGGPQIYAFTLTYSGNRAESLGIVTAGSTIGFTLGSFAPILAERVGGGTILSVMGLLVVLVYLIIAGMAGSLKPEGPGYGGGDRRVPIIITIIATALAFTGVEIIGSVYMARLSEEVGTTLYSLANAGAGIVGAVARPLAGKLIDYAGPTPVLSTTLLLYAVYTVLLDASKGIAMALLWIIPLYPVFELSLYKLASSVAGEAMGTATVSSSYSLTGAILFAFGYANVGNQGLSYVAVASFLLAIPLALAVSPRLSRRRVYYAYRRGERNI